MTEEEIKPGASYRPVTAGGGNRRVLSISTLNSYAVVKYIRRQMVNSCSLSAFAKWAKEEIK